MTTAATFAHMYPQLDKFRRIKKQVDPGNLFTSSQARRLGIIDDPLSSGISSEIQA